MPGKSSQLNASALKFYVREICLDQQFFEYTTESSTTEIALISIRKDKALFWSQA